VNFLINNSKSGLDVNVAVINLDKGSLGKEMLEELGVSNLYVDKVQAIKDLKNYDYLALYEIPESFSENINENTKPIINSYKIEEGNNTGVFEANLEEKVNELLKANILIDNKIISNRSEIDKNIIDLQYNLKQGLLTTESFFPILLILFFLVTFSSNISTDLLSLRKGKILERFLSTNNKGYQIMGSIYLSMLIAQTTMYTLSFVVMDVIFKYKFENFGMLVLNIVLMSAISISLGVMISRIFQDPGVATVVITLLSIVLFFIYVGGMNGETSTSVTGILVTLSKFTPFYWAMDSIEKSILFPNAFILILMALVFFSAGSIKYSSFAKKV
ncbi:MAG: family transporter protein, partial [Clostridiales bacterium]|nr:family transporter protein [Clostridiales bacterium]